MNTRITNRLWRGVGIAVASALLLLAPARVHASAPSGKPDPDAATEDTEKKLPPILQKALEQKEGEVVDARREAIKLLEAYLAENPRGSAGFRAKEQAEALYKLAELY